MTDYIHFIATGGTIDSEYYPPRETSVPNKESVIESYIRTKIKPSINMTFETLFMLDSGDITDAHRAQLVESIRKTPAQRVIVCHGTNTMAETGTYLALHLGNQIKTVVLVGSMIPLKEFAMSDAGFNLGYAVAEIGRLERGIYLCMNARTFAAGKVRKNFSEGRFECYE